VNFFIEEKASREISGRTNDGKVTCMQKITKGGGPPSPHFYCPIILCNFLGIKRSACFGKNDGTEKKISTSQRGKIAEPKKKDIRKPTGKKFQSIIGATFEK